jgi:hypothetical protein
MAKAFPPYPISGSIGNYTFFRYGDQTIVREKIWIPRPKEYAKQNPRHRENRQTFGGASKTAAHIYKGLRTKQRGQMLPYSHNFIATKLKRHAERTQRAVDQFTFRAAHSALQGLDLSRKESPSKLLSITPIGPHHHPHEIHIQGLQEAAKAILSSQTGTPIHGNAHIELRIQLRFVEFNQMTFDEADQEWRPKKQFHDTVNHSTSWTQWIPTEILPQEGLLVPIANHTRGSNPDSNADSKPPLLIFLKIEWREVREVDQITKPILGMGITRLVAMQYDEATAEEIAKIQQTKKPIVPEPDFLAEARKDPKEYLKQALKVLTPPG